VVCQLLLLRGALSEVVVVVHEERESTSACHDVLADMADPEEEVLVVRPEEVGNHLLVLAISIPNWTHS
jgi:hypothetical protein